MTTAIREQIFDFVRDTIERRRSAPTFDEIGQHFGMSAVGAWKHVKALIAEGRLTHRKGYGARYLAVPNSVDLSPVPTQRLQSELARRRAVEHAGIGR